MTLFAMLSSCNVLFDRSSNLMLFLLSLKLLLFAILPCPFEHVLVFSGDSSVFRFCHDLPVLHADAFCSYVGVLYLVVLMLARCLVAVLDSLSFKLV